jgi:hypothetical protein
MAISLEILFINFCASFGPSTEICLINSTNYFSLFTFGLLTNGLKFSSFFSIVEFIPYLLVRSKDSPEITYYNDKIYYNLAFSIAKMPNIVGLQQYLE